jgi:hypothetical protein
VSLAHDHLADLKSSGLDEDTIAALGVESVRPADIPIKQAESAYRIRYYDMDGKPNGFYRLKLVPPVIGADGHKIKYYQSPGSGPHLYLPPVLNWRTAARSVRTELTITEGEKKAVAGCAQGLITAGIGGVWCWTSTLDIGDRLTLPMLDEFQWTARPVSICPDSDAWRDNEKGEQILRGFFAFAKDLQQRGADVRFVVLPDVHGVKAGLDDWFLVPGNNADDSWNKLPRLPLDHGRFDRLNAWWQRWKEKHAAHEAIKQHDAEELFLTEAAGLFTVRSSKHATSITFDRLSDERGGTKAELCITLGQTEILNGVDLGLKSDSGQTKLAQSLKSIAPTIPWKWLLQRACSLVLKRHREGEPLRVLTKDTAVEPLTFQVNPLVFAGKPTVLFGDGGLGKSSFALLCAMMASTGGMVAGLSAIKGRALILDYEDTHDVHVRRMQAIAAAHPALAGAEVRYQACTEPLANLTHPLLRQIQAEAITFVVLDSLMAATGGDASAEAAAKVFRAIRTFGVGTLILAHTPKNPGEGQDPSIYGSVFHKNFARSTWELRKEQEVGADESLLGLFNRKSNLSRLHPPIGFKVTQNRESSRMAYEAFDLSQAGELAGALPLANRIRTVLEDGAPRKSKAIAEEIGAALPTVKATLSKHKGRKWHMLGDGKEALWTVLNR